MGIESVVCFATAENGIERNYRAVQREDNRAAEDSSKGTRVFIEPRKPYGTRVFIEQDKTSLKGTKKEWLKSG